MKNFIYLLEGALLHLLMTIFSILPLDAASSFGGWIGRTIGPRLGVTKRAYKHLEIAFPGIPQDKKAKIALGMWDNLGRVIGEYPHLEIISKTRIDIKNEHIISEALAQNKGGLFVSAHIGNWETHVPALLARHGVAASLTYRGLNNPYADNILKKFRTMHGKLKAYPKARESAKLLLTALKNKGFIAMLIDQKFNEGVEAPFFGKPAMTNPAYIQLAQRYKAPVVLVQCKRLKGANFELVPSPPLNLFDAEGKNIPLETVIAEAHVILESWIRETPEQWLWLHKRWKNPN